MKKMLFISILSIFLCACSDNEDTYCWEIYVENIENITCTGQEINEMLEHYPFRLCDLTESKIKIAISNFNKSAGEWYDAGDIDCLPVFSYRKESDQSPIPLK